MKNIQTSNFYTLSTSHVYGAFPIPPFPQVFSEVVNSVTANGVTSFLNGETF